MNVRSHRPRRGLVLITALLSLATALGGCSHEPPKAAPPRAVRVLEVQPKDARVASRYSGALIPRVQVDLAFKVGGRMSRIAPVKKGGRALQEGDAVRRGQELASLEPGDLQLQARAAAAGVASAAAQERAAAAAAQQAEAEVQRARTLFASGNLPQADLDRAEAGFATARANFTAAQGQRRAKADQHALAASALSDAILRSPIDGLIGRRMVEAGESVAPGRPVFTLIDTTEMRMVFGVPDMLVNTLQVGQRLPVAIDALPGRTAVGLISKISPVADPALRSYSIEITIPNPDGALKAGMVASVELERDPQKASMLVPLSAVVRAPQGGGFAVYVLADDRAARLRPVEVGDLFGSDVAIAKGLSPGDRVVIDGAPFLRDGAVVEVVP